MPNTITKRDGRVVPFDPVKITNAIAKAFRAVDSEVFPSQEELYNLTDEVVNSLNDPERKYTVDDVQNQVERVLMKSNWPDQAREYIIYRNHRDELRDSNRYLNKLFAELVSTDAGDMDLKRENANIDGNAPMGIMLRMGSEANKQFCKQYMMNPEYAELHNNGTWHIHDLDFYNITFNCCQIPVGKLLKHGFNTGHGFIREPNSIRTAAALACICIQSNQNDMFGGQSVPMFEYDLAPYVVKSFYKYLKITFDLVLKDESPELAISLAQDIYEKEGTLLDGDRLERLTKLIAEEYQIFHRFDDIYTAVIKAYELTKAETYQAMEAVIHNLNSMHSRAGAQVPFSGINYGTGTTAEQRLIILDILKATDAGLGNGETPIFPVQIFKVKDGINTKPSDPNYDLFRLACAVSAKRLFPNFSFIDSSFNLPYYKPNEPETEVAYMGCLSGSSVITVKNFYTKQIEILPIEEFVSYENYLDYRVYDSISGSFVPVTNVINNPPSKDWFRVKFSNGRYTDVTSNHYFPVDSKGRTIVGNLEPGDKVKASDLSFIPESPDYDRTPTMTEEAWLWGLVIRDGNYDKSSIAVCVGMDEYDIVETAQKYFEHLGFDTVIKEWHREEKGNYYELRVKRCKDYCQRLTKIFRGTLKVNRNIPLGIINSVAAVHFLAGMIDADGYVNVLTGRAKCQLGCINEALSLQTFTIANALGLNPKIYINNRKGRKAQYNVEFELSSELVDALRCSKKRDRAHTTTPASIKRPNYVEVTEIIPLNVEQKSYCLSTDTDRFDVNGICSHNCRTRVISNRHGPEIVPGRGNFSFVTLNLPRLGIQAQRSYSLFYDRLEELMDKAVHQLLDRYHLIAQKHVYNFPFLMGQEVWMGSEELNPEDTIESVLKHSSLSVGFIGLAECLKALTGHHHGESEEADNEGYGIVAFMRGLLDLYAKKYDLNFSLFATPAEGLSGRFVKIDRQIYGSIPGVTDRDYYTNSFHVPVYYDITAAKKIEIEGKYHKLCNAGHITYVEVDGDLTKNVDAFMSLILYMKQCDVGYGSINHPVDRCPVCGYTGIIHDVCPKCGRHDGEAVSVEKLKSLGVCCHE